MKEPKGALCVFVYACVYVCLIIEKVFISKKEKKKKIRKWLSIGIKLPAMFGCEMCACGRGSVRRDPVVVLANR